MGRYVTSGQAQVNSCVAYSPTTCYQVSGYKYAYDANECWNNRVIVDTPGSYSFTVPANTSGCFRVISVGGGGKVKCTNGNCCGFAGAGGGYAEKWDAINAGCTINIVVGRQEQDTTISYTNSSGVARTVTGGGAAGCVQGAASGGDWNSIGGCAGYNCQYCGGSVTHYCGACIYTSATTCCGYCVVYTGIAGRNIDPPHDSVCCNGLYAGGGSAGSWIWTSGGAGQNAASALDTQGNSYGAKAGGGGGIGAICVEPMRGSNCSCVCTFQNGYNGGGNGNPCRKINYPSGAGGGGGTKYQCCLCYVGHTMNGICQNGMWRNGPGGWGGKNTDEGRNWTMVFHHGDNPNSHNFGRNDILESGPAPKKYDWHDIHSMAGSGSQGSSMNQSDYRGVCGFVSYHITDPYAQMQNAGEGAGTGGTAYHCCEMSSMGFYCCRNGVDAYGTVNWQLLCCLGTSNRICCADKLQDQLFPYVISCAGTLGGSGGVGICNMASKAGKGGGAGVYRSYLTCVCWGGNYNYCNGNPANPLLAFPPCDLDWRVSTAGTGMAIIYWKD